MEKALRYSPSLIAVPHGSTPLTNPEKMNTRATIHRRQGRPKGMLFHIVFSFSRSCKCMQFIRRMKHALSFARRRSRIRIFAYRSLSKEFGTESNESPEE